MKKITFLLFFLTASLGFSQQVLLEDFEGAAPTITTANGLGSAAIATDPAMGTNGNVLEIISSAAGDPWQQADMLLQNGDIDLTTDFTVTVDIYSANPINVLAKVDDGAPASATDMVHGGTGWETLVFDFSDPKDNTVAANGVYNKISFFPSWAGAGSGTSTVNADWNNGVDGTTIYIDNINAETPAMPTCTDGIQNGDETGVDCGGTNCAPCAPPASPECIENFEATAPTITLTNGLGSASITADPGTGSNGNVLEIVSAAAGDPWQQADLLLQNNTIDLTSDTNVTIEVYSSSPINVLAKVDVGATASATDSAHGGTGWESLVFDFSDPKDNTPAANGIYSQISFFPSWAGAGSGTSTVNADWNNGVDGTTIYINCITAVPGTPTPVPTNDDCGMATAEALALSAQVAIDNTGSTDSGVATCYSGDVRDVWYSFTAPTSGEVTITVGAGTQFALFSDCTTEVSCNTAANVGLTAAATYYISVTDDGTNKAPGASTIQVDDTTTLSADEFSVNEFAVFPNPTNNDWNVRGNQKVNTVELYDVLGKQVFSLNPNNKEFTISGTSLNSGLYFAKINSNSGTTTIKLVKE